MSNLLWWILLGSVFVALAIMVFSWLITRSKIKKIQQKNTTNENGSQVLIRKNVGELLWDLKKRSKDPLDDLQMEMILSTAFRNNFKKVCLPFRNNYVQKTLEKLGKQKIVDKNYDWVVLNTDQNINQIFDSYYKESKKNTMIVVINLKNNNKEIKKLKNYLKLTNIRNDYENIGKGMLFIVK